jgi:5-methylcytosine-specific restriction endonuclease McrA
MQHVFVLDTDRKPIDPVEPGKARILLSSGKAAVLRRYPFTIIMKERMPEATQEYEMKIDPGSKETGVSLINKITRKIIFSMVITHRGNAISEALLKRSGIRRSRRNRKTRYRKPGLANTVKPEGWLAPSLLHRVLTTMTWVERLMRFAPVTAISMELVKFNLQKMENPEISGVEYQQGTLAGYETKEYLLEKYDRKCCYCDKTGVPLEVEHIKAKANGGSNRVSNLGIACVPCNIKKGTLDIREFLKDNPARLGKLLMQLKVPLKDATAVNSTRLALFNQLKATGLPVETGSGGQTKFNRTTLGLPKEHWIDAACVGASGADIVVPACMVPLQAKATGHGCRQVTRTDKSGFPRQTAKKGGPVIGFQTGDMVKAIVTKGKKIGTYVGKVAVRATGKFNIQTNGGVIQGISHKYCSVIHRKDGYSYS